jgi:hypothetical protein
VRDGVGTHQPQGYPLDRNVVKPTIRKAAMAASPWFWLSIVASVVLLSALSHFIRVSYAMGYQFKFDRLIDTVY